MIEAMHSLCIDSLVVVIIVHSYIVQLFNSQLCTLATFLFSFTFVLGHCMWHQLTGIMAAPVDVKL